MSFRFPIRSRKSGRPVSVQPPRLRVESLEDRTVPSTFTVHNLADSGAGSLRQAILDANANPGADLIRFAAAARDGTIVLTSGQLNITDALQIDGPGAGRLAVSGNDTGRVFQIGSGVAVSIDDLTVTRGRGLLRGGGIRNDGVLTLSDAVVADNVVVGLPAVGQITDVAAFGGGIFNTGTLTVRDTTFVHNRSLGAAGNPGGSGSGGLGGAIMSAGLPGAPAAATVSDCTFVDNQAVGGAAGPGAPGTLGALGGAIMNDNCTLTVSDSVFLHNRAIGGFGGGLPGRPVAGGAIANVPLFGDSILSVSHCTLIDNQAIGGVPGAGSLAQVAKGGGIANFLAGVAAISVTVAATARIDHSVLLGNQAIGGDGPTGGTGQGGGITNENGGTLVVTDSLLALNRAVGGVGTSGSGGSGLGGGVFNGPPNPFGTPSLTIQRSRVALNRAEGGAGAGGSAGLGQGGGLYLAPGGLAFADSWTLAFANDASTSDDDVFGILT